MGTPNKGYKKNDTHKLSDHFLSPSLGQCKKIIGTMTVKCMKILNKNDRFTSVRRVACVAKLRHCFDKS